MVVTSTKELSKGATLLLGIQHLFAMFGSTVLVPALTGLNPSVALICAGIGTLIFHFVTGHKVPVFVGSSFAFLAALRAVKQRLEVEGLFDQLAESFANLVVFHCLFNDDAPASWAEVFAELGVSGLPEHAFWLDGDYERYTRLVLASWEEGNGLACAYGKDFWYKAALLERADLERSAQRADELQRRVDDAWRETELVKASLSFRGGSTLTAPIRKLREG